MWQSITICWVLCYTCGATATVTIHKTNHRNAKSVKPNRIVSQKNSVDTVLLYFRDITFQASLHCTLLPQGQVSLQAWCEFGGIGDFDRLESRSCEVDMVQSSARAESGGQASKSGFSDLLVTKDIHALRGCAAPMAVR